MSLTTHVICRMNKDFVKKNGNSALYLLVNVNKEWDKFPLKLDWKAGYFDEDNGLVKPRTKDDKEINDYNLIIRREVGRVNEIFLKYRINGNPLNMQILRLEYFEPSKAENFVDYIPDKINKRIKRKEISWGTKNAHFSAYRMLIAYKQKITYYDLTPKLIEGFSDFMKKRIAANTMASYLRIIKSYINLAIEDFDLKLINPFEKAKVSLKDVDTDREHLLKAEMKLLFDYYKALDKHDIDRVVLSRFFVSCYTGLRISDIMLLTEQSITEGIKAMQLAIHPKKGQRFGKIVYIDLSEASAKYLNDILVNLALYREGTQKYNKVAVTEQYGNRRLKVIAQKLEIKKALTYHVGRHTFATNFLRAGGRVEYLKDILGHSSLEMTMRYVHIVNSEKKASMNDLANFYH